MTGLKRAALPVVAVLVSLPASLSAQDIPDLSGTWVLESAAPPASGIPREMLVRESVARTSVRGEPIEPTVDEVAVTRVFDDDSRSEIYRMGVESGQASGQPGFPAVLTRQQARWDERALVIETRSSSGSTPGSGPWSERREVWSLDSRGRLRLAVTARSSTQASRTVIVLYRRQ